MRILNTIPTAGLLVISLILVMGSANGALAQVSLVNVGSTNDGGTAFTVAVSGNYAYLANGADGLRVYDVSNPGSPTCVGHTNDQGYSFGIAVAGNYAYLSSDYDGLRVYDISSPSDPINIGHAYNGGFGGFAIAVRDHYVFLKCNGMEIYDVADPTNPVQLAHGLSGYSSLAFSSNYLYISNPNSGHTIYGYDISNPASPTNVYISPGAYVFGLATSGHYLFGGSQNFQPAAGQFISGLIAFDISNPTNPVYLATSGGPAFAGGQVVISGNYAYWANGNYGLQVYDVSNPTGTNILKVGEVKKGTAEGVVVSGHYAYVANGTDGLQIYSVTPTLNVSLTASNTVLLSWPDVGHFVAQENSDLGTSNWTTIDQTPVNVGAKSQLLLSYPGTNTFYRLVSE